MWCWLDWIRLDCPRSLPGHLVVVIVSAVVHTETRGLSDRFTHLITWMINVKQTNRTNLTGSLRTACLLLKIDSCEPKAYDSVHGKRIDFHVTRCMWRGNDSNRVNRTERFDSLQKSFCALHTTGRRRNTRNHLNRTERLDSLKKNQLCRISAEG